MRISFRISDWKNSTITHTLWYVCIYIITHVIYHSTVTTQLPGSNGYTGGKVVFIDTEVYLVYCLFTAWKKLLLLLFFAEYIVSYSSYLLYFGFVYLTVPVDLIG